MADPRLADAKIKKIIGNVTKLIFFILTLKTSCNSSNSIYIYDFSEVMVKYEFGQ